MIQKTGVIYYIYMLRCSNNSYYTGYTTDLARRYQEHVDGTSKCKYTRSFKPINIAQSWMIPDCKSTALKVEKFIKKLSKHAKERLVVYPNQLIQFFPEICVNK